MMTSITAIGWRFSVPAWTRGTSNVFSTSCTPKYSKPTQMTFSGADANVTSIPAAPPINGPTMGIISDTPAMIPRTPANGTPMATRPIVTATPTIAPKIS